jgi:hypothetical protein
VIDVRPAPYGFEHYRRGGRQLTFESTPTSGVVSAGASRTLNVPVLRLNTGVVAGAVDKMAEACEGSTTNLMFAGPLAGGNQWQRPIHVSGFVAFPFFGFGAASEFGGLQLGSIGAAALPALPLTPLIRLFGAGDGRFYLLTARGDGTAPVTLDLGPHIALGGADAHRLTIDYRPGEFVEAMIDGGLFRGRTTGGSVPNGIAIAMTGFGAGAFVHAGPVNGEQAIMDAAYLYAETLGVP